MKSNKSPHFRGLNLHFLQMFSRQNDFNLKSLIMLYVLIMLSCWSTDRCSTLMLKQLIISQLIEKQ